jgi:hypothetical protein
MTAAAGFLLRSSRSQSFSPATPLACLLWNLLPKLRFLQFPWRWLVVLEAPMGLFFAAAVWPRPPRAGCAWPSRPLRSGFFSPPQHRGHSFFQPCDDEDAVAPMVQVYRSGAGFRGSRRVRTRRTRTTPLSRPAFPDACLVTDPRDPLGVLDTPGANPDWWVEQHSCDATFYPPSKESGTSPHSSRAFAARRLPDSAIADLSRLAHHRQWPARGQFIGATTA